MDSQWKAPFDKFRPTPFKPLHLVTPGHGGTYTFRNAKSSEPKKPRHLGFSGCYDSVGVYFAIDDQRCFAANISAWIKTEANEVGIASTATPEGTDSQKVYERVSQEIAHRLNMESAKSGWAGPKTDVMRGTLIMTGRWMSKGSRTAMLQTAVAHAVQDWLGIPRAKYKSAERDGVLIIEHPGEVVVRAGHWLDASHWSVLGGDEVDLPWQVGANFT
ncbi:hypothetical protein LTR65_007747 [Meristemomyces frigidus]